MPMYEFECPRDGKQTVRAQIIDGRNTGFDFCCKICGTPMKRLFSTPGLTNMETTRLR